MNAQQMFWSNHFATNYPYYRDWGAEKLAQAEAASRAISRHTCCKSQFKFKCFSCGEHVQRGDLITMCHDTSDGMTLRSRGGDATDGLAAGQTCFYQPSSGTKRWVHIGCQPCHWHRSENYPPELVGIWTDWGAKLETEYQDWYVQIGGLMPDFIAVTGYPPEKFMSDRIINAITKFQALWRGYLYKQAYLIALRAKKATEAININSGNTGKRSWKCLVVAGADRQPPHPPRFQEGDKVECPFDLNTCKESIHNGSVVKAIWLDANTHKNQPKAEWWYIVRFMDGDAVTYSETKLIRRVKEAANLKYSLNWHVAFNRVEIYDHCWYTKRFLPVPDVDWEREPYHDY